MRHLLTTTFRLAPLLLALLLLVPIATAQNGIQATDAEIETDPFTDETTCSQFIADWDDGDVTFAMMSTVEDNGDLSLTFGYTRGWRDLIYDELADPDQDRVLMRIGPEVYTLPVVDAWYSEGNDTEGVTVQRSRSLLHALANAEQSVPVRFESDYSGLRYDYVMPMEMIEAHADGFAQACLY